MERIKQLTVMSIVRLCTNMKHLIVFSYHRVIYTLSVRYLSQDAKKSFDRKKSHVAKKKIGSLSTEMLVQ